MLTMTLTLTQTLTLTLLTLVPCSVLTTADPVRGLYRRLYLILEAENEAAVLNLAWELSSCHCPR